MNRTEPEREPEVEQKRQNAEMTLQGERVLDWELTWPECVGSRRELKGISDYYRRLAAAWKRRWEREVYPRACLDLAQRQAQGKPFRPWRARLDTHITWREGGVLSLRQEVTECWGYDRPLVLRTGDTWSLADGAPLTLSSFFGGRRQWKKKLLAQVEGQVRERLASGESLLDPDSPSKLKKEFDPQRFCLTREGLELFYPMYVLAPGAEGIPAFTVQMPEG